jgi:glucose/arabinose dehydrogenase
VIPRRRGLNRPATPPATPATAAWRAATTASLLSLLALVAASCGSDDQATPGPSVTFSTQPPSPTPVTVETTVAPPASSESTADTAAPTEPTEAVEPTTSESIAPVPLADPSIALVSIGSFEQPVDLAWRTGDPTAYIVERVGRIVPFRDGRSGSPVLDITDLTEGQGERGLLGLTFSADGTHAYLDHTDNAGDTVIVEYAVASDGTFDAASRRVLLTIDQPYSNHNGGNVAIGPDGMLYIGMGDGGDGGDPQRFSLNVSSLLGKILRIDPTASADQQYTVPSDNPFVGVEGARPEIWAVGVRNPWRFSFDSLTGDLWIADVGQGELEEIDVAWAADGGGRGLNFGWSAFEGTKRFNGDQAADGVTPPIHEYEHATGGCSISGGAVYRGESIPSLVGWYVFGDYCNGLIQALRVEDRVVTRVLPLATQGQNAAIRVGPDGELWAISIGGDVSRIIAA